MARYTSLRYWHWDSQPSTPLIETKVLEDDTPGNPDGFVVSVANPVPDTGATIVDKATYDTLLGSNQAPKDLYEIMADNLAASQASHAVACEDAYNDLVANGLLPATATFLTGHTP